MAVAPAAPTRPRRAPLTRTNKAPVASGSNTQHGTSHSQTITTTTIDTDTNQLADAFGKSLHISTKPSVAGRRVVSACAGSGRALVGSSSRTPAAGSSKLEASTSRAKEPEAGQSPQEQARAAMKSVNTSLQHLAALNKAGFRLSSTSFPSPPSTTATSSRPASTSSSSKDKGKDTTMVQVRSACQACEIGLGMLRRLIAKGEVNNRASEVEKAAGSAVANLVEMECVSFFHLLLVWMLMWEGLMRMGTL